MSFDLSDYVDVAERIRIFRAAHPAGSLQSEIDILKNIDGHPIAVVAKAMAYRNADDVIPGIGHSWLAVPGTTPYTRGSEVENAETSAWGRAIVAALAADTKKVASADEIRAKDSGAVVPSAAAGTGAGVPQTPAPTKDSGAHKAVASGVGDVTAPAAGATGLGGAPAATFTWQSGKHQGKSLEDTDRSYIEWYAEKGPKEDVRAICNAFLLGEELVAVGAAEVAPYDIDDLPF